LLAGASDEGSREFADVLHQVWGIAEPFDFAHDRAADPLFI
jgi:hypothetical protein